MKIAILGLFGLAACSGSSAKPAGPHTGGETLDAGADPVVVAAPDAEPPGPSCVPRDSELVAIVDGAMVLCGAAGCLALGADGALAETTRPESTLPQLEECKDPDDWCAIDAAGTHVVRADGDEKAITVVVHDAATNKKLASTKIKGAKDPDGHDWYVRYVGTTVVVTDAPRAGDDEINTMWTLAGKKLKKVATLTGKLGQSTMVEPGRGALVIDDVVDVRDLATGKSVGTLAWTALGETTGTVDPKVFVADAAGEVAVVLTHYQSPWAAGVFPATGGDPRPYAITACD